MVTYQDFEKEPNKAIFVRVAIQKHMGSAEYNTALDADKYDAQRNVTINEYTRTIYALNGKITDDPTKANNKLASNFFNRLNTQRCTYLLGNGVSFSKGDSKRDTTKEALGDRFDTDLKITAYNALIHGVSFGFWNLDRLYNFPLTQFVPIWDEDTGALRAGVRFWRLSPDKPMTAVLYEEDGYTTYKSKPGQNNLDFAEEVNKKPYKQTYRVSEADGEEVVGEQNYSSLPIVPLWGSRLHQSTLIGIRSKIDSYDLIQSGFANDMQDCAEIFWLMENYMGMKDKHLQEFLNRLKFNHVAVVDSENGKVTPYTQNIPYEARSTYLASIRASIYEDFGGLDVHTVAAGATNDHIDAAYQPMDENADDFEYQVIEFVQQILKLIGIEDVPVFKRNRISNQMEQVQMVMMEADYLDSETLLQKLPNVTVDEVDAIISKRNAESASRIVREDEETLP